MNELPRDIEWDWFTLMGIAGNLSRISHLVDLFLNGNELTSTGFEWE